MPVPPLVVALARALVAGEQQIAPCVQRAATTVGWPARRLTPLARRYVARFATGTRPRLRDVVRFLRDDPALASVGQPGARRRLVKEWLPEPLRMQPVPAAAEWTVPPIESVGALAEWLGITTGELAWFADLKALGAKAKGPRLGHYHYALHEKRRGGVRLIEAPQARLKAMQRRILSDILERVPPYESAAHGFVKGRSIRTFAAQHAGQHVVLRMDLQDFFPRVSGTRVQALFRTMGYPEPVADLLGGICTNVAPRRLFDAARFPAVDAALLAESRRVYTRPHLPQGAPTSPALANLCAYRLDARLTGLADWAGAVYSRYADDIAFSGGEDVARRVERYALQIAAIALEEGWPVQHRKTRVMRRGVRQHLTGLTVNDGVNVSRAAFDTLKATLTNCVRHGPESQNRDGHPDFRAHLAGRVAFVQSINAAKGERLHAILERIEWPSP